MREVMLTTTDNPFDPFDEWNRFDEDAGYFTCSYLARIAKTSDELGENDESGYLEDAIDDICRLNITGKYKKVVRET